MTAHPPASQPIPDFDALVIAGGDNDGLRVMLGHRVGVLEGALKHIMWIKDGGVDGTDEHGVFRNFPETERDAMYEIARTTLAGAASIEPADKELEKDAARYRLIRQQKENLMQYCFSYSSMGFADICDAYEREALDAAIDAHLAALADGRAEGES